MTGKEDDHRGRLIGGIILIGIGLILAFLIFSYFCFYQFPNIFFGK